MKLVRGLAVLALLASCASSCSNNNNSSAPAVVTPTSDPNPVAEAQPKEGKFSARENHSRDLGQFVSGQNGAGIFCNLKSVPDSVYGRLINIEAMWTWQNPANKADQEFYRIRIEAQSPRMIMPGKNSYDFIDAQVRLFRSKSRKAALTEFNGLAPEAYGCDVNNLEQVDQKFKGRILCYKNNVYHAYNLRLNFECLLN